MNITDIRTIQAAWSAIRLCELFYSMEYAFEVSSRVQKFTIFKAFQIFTSIDPFCSKRMPALLHCV